MNSTVKEKTPERPDWKYRLAAFGVILLLLVAAAALPYAYHRAGLYAKSADEAARTFEAWNLVQSGRIHIGPWLPLHTITMATVLHMWNDLFLAPRALSMGLSVLIVAALGWLGTEVSRRRGAALITMGLGVCFGPRVVLAAVPLSETLYMLWLVLGTAAFARWLRLARLRWFLTGSLFIGLAACTRYEGWLFAAATTLFAAVWLHFDRNATRSIRFAALIASVFLLWIGPVAWCIAWYRTNGEFFGFLGFSGNRYFDVVNPEHNFARLWRDSVFYQAWRQNLFSLNLLGSVGVILYFIERRSKALWLLIPLIAFVALGALGLRGHALPTHNFWRIAAPFSVLLLAFTANTVLTFATKDGYWRPAAWGRAVVTVIVLLLAFHFQCFKLAEYSELDDDDLAAAAFVRTELEKRDDTNARVFIEDSDVRWHHVRILSGYPKNFLPAAPVDSVLKLQLLDLDKLREDNVAIIVLHEEYSINVPRVEAFSAADKNDRWVMLTLAKKKSKEDEEAKEGE